MNSKILDAIDKLEHVKAKINKYLDFEDDGASTFLLVEEVIGILKSVTYDDDLPF